MNLKTRQELIDYDYLDKLGPDELAWLNKFTSEYVGADLDRQNFDNNLHNTLELKQDCDRRNNLRKKDLFTALKVNNMIDNWEDYKTRVAHQEDLLDQVDDLNHPGYDTDDTEESGTGESDDF